MTNVSSLCFLVFVLNILVVLNSFDMFDSFCYEVLIMFAFDRTISCLQCLKFS